MLYDGEHDDSTGHQQQSHDIDDAATHDEQAGVAWWQHQPQERRSAEREGNGREPFPWVVHPDQPESDADSGEDDDQRLTKDGCAPAPARYDAYGRSVGTALRLLG